MYKAHKQRVKDNTRGVDPRGRRNGDKGAKGTEGAKDAY